MWKISIGSISTSANVMHGLMHAYLLLFCSSIGCEKKVVSLAFTILEIFWRKWVFTLCTSLYSCNKKWRSDAKFSIAHHLVWPKRYCLRMLFSETSSTQFFPLLRHCQIWPTLRESLVGNAGGNILAIVWLQNTTWSNLLAQLRWQKYCNMPFWESLIKSFLLYSRSVSFFLRAATS